MKYKVSVKMSRQAAIEIIFARAHVGCEGGTLTGTTGTDREISLSDPALKELEFGAQCEPHLSKGFLKIGGATLETSAYGSSDDRDIVRQIEARLNGIASIFAGVLPAMVTVTVTMEKNPLSSGFFSDILAETGGDIVRAPWGEIERADRIRSIVGCYRGTRLLKFLESRGISREEYQAAM